MSGLPDSEEAESLLSCSVDAIIGRMSANSLSGDGSLRDEDWRRFGEVVRNARLVAGLSQKTIAERGGPSDTTLTKIEMGTWRPTRSTEVTLRKLEIGFGWDQGTAPRLLSGMATDAPDSGSDMPAEALSVLLANYVALRDLDVGDHVLAPLEQQLLLPLRRAVTDAARSASLDDLLAASEILGVDVDGVGDEGERAPGGGIRGGQSERESRPVPEVVTEDGVISLRALRESRQLKLGDVATAVSRRRASRDAEASVLSRGTLSAVETGKRGLGAELAADLAAVLDIRHARDHIFEV